jgi:hypothetical protein
VVRLLSLEVRNSDASCASSPTWVKSVGSHPVSDSSGVVRNDPDVEEIE